MKFIQKLGFEDNALQAIEKYKEAFGCKEKSVILYEDAVKNGWAEPNPMRNGTVFWRSGSPNVRYSGYRSFTANT